MEEHPRLLERERNFRGGRKWAGPDVQRLWNEDNSAALLLSELCLYQL